MHVGSILASGAIETADLQAGQNINAGSIYAGNIQAGGSITAANGIDAVGGSITAGGDITSTGLLRLLRDDNDLIGNITAGGNIFAGGGILTSADSSVTAAGDIFAPQVVAGTLTAGGNITDRQHAPASSAPVSSSTPSRSDDFVYQYFAGLAHYTSATGTMPFLRATLP